MKLFSHLMAVLVFLLQAVPGLGLPKDTLRCVRHQGLCFRSKVCPEPFAALGTCSWRRKTCCIDTTLSFRTCQDHCVSPRIKCLQEEVGLCRQRGWRCCKEI
ncbi:GLL11 protein, partial [Alectura lathami]|nr:GLL11 protein [Alectura lathami]